MPFSIHQEDNLNVIICSLHPHKALLKPLRVRSYCIRKGWGKLKTMFKQADKEA